MVTSSLENRTWPRSLKRDEITGDLIDRPKENRDFTLSRRRTYQIKNGLALEYFLTKEQQDKVKKALKKKGVNRVLVQADGHGYEKCGRYSGLFEITSSADLDLKPRWSPPPPKIISLDRGRRQKFIDQTPAEDKRRIKASQPLVALQDARQGGHVHPWVSRDFEVHETFVVDARSLLAIAYFLTPETGEWAVEAVQESDGELLLPVEMKRPEGGTLIKIRKEDARRHEDIIPAGPEKIEHPGLCIIK